MNLTVRMKNPVFWAQVAAAAALQIMAYFGLTGADFTTWPMVWQTVLQAVRNPYLMVCVAAAVWNALNDPTTAGLADSARAMAYTAPYREEV
ncbi:MAG: phage holin [Oscillospiraceae bacterium]|nr:phage holin [Oscillospiraceae bacterium]